MTPYGITGDGHPYSPPRPVSTQPPRYTDDQAPTTLRPCYVCGEPAPQVPFLYATDVDYGACGWPLDRGDSTGIGLACVERAEAKERAKRSAEAATARAEPAPADGRVRPSQARKTLLGAAVKRKPPAA